MTDRPPNPGTPPISSTPGQAGPTMRWLGDPEPGFTPISPNPFIVGNPVRDPAMFFGREAEFELVRARFQDSTGAAATSRGGVLLVFCGERRSGKTSILFQILDKRLGPDFIPVLIDMQSMAVGNEIDFLMRVSEEIRAALGPDGAGIAPPEFKPDSNHYATFRKFVKEVLKARPHKKLILLFDEYELFENKIDSRQLSQEALLILAHLMENERVYLIFTGSQHLDQRRRDYWETFLPKSHFKMISFLEREDAIHLMRKPVEGRVRYADGTVEAIYRLTAGQPFYTQAICQSLVDDLNEKRTHDATLEMVAEVVDGIVNNPFPQMIFLWDGLERDEQLVLALLAECLPEEGSYAGVDDLRRLHNQRRYELGLVEGSSSGSEDKKHRHRRGFDEGRVAPTLEKLFKSDMLLRSDRTKRPQYAFRMDLWRLWIRRQHSVWQVRRALKIPPPPPPIRPVYVVTGAVAVVAVLAIAISSDLRDRIGNLFSGTGSPAGTSHATPAGPSAHFTLVPDPPDAMVYLDERAIGGGAFAESIAAAHEHRFRLTSPGYADTNIVVPAIAAGGSARREVALRPLFGDLRVATEPSGAEVKVDGVSHGRSPVTVRGLAAARAHQVEATLSGFSPAHETFAVQPDSLVPITLVLPARAADVWLTTEPASCSIAIDGVARGVSPHTLNGISFGNHTFSASREGFLAADSTLVVSEITQALHLVLLPEPSGWLIVQGDQLADIYIADNLVKSDAQNSGPQSLQGGTYQVQVTLKTGATVDTTLQVKPRKTTTFDYSRRTVTLRP